MTRTEEKDEEDRPLSGRPAEPAANALPLRLLLRFSDAGREQAFVAHYVAVYRRYAQAGLLLGMLLICGDFLIDHLARPEVQANWLRLQLCLPLLGLGLAGALLPATRRHWQGTMAAFIVALGACLFWILLHIDAQGGAGLRSWVGVLNFTFLQFYCFVILGVQFRHALVAGSLILCAFAVAMAVDVRWSAAEVAYWSYHVFTLFLLAAGIGWWREYLLRKEFIAVSDLEQARAAAEQLARIKGDFLTTMSHEIRTPLNGVLGMNELLIRSELRPQQRAWAEGVQSSGRHLLGVINDILDFSKAESGQMPLDAVDFVLLDVVEEALLMFAQPAQSKGLELALQYAPALELQALRGDPFRLRQVIANLLSNAVKFTAAGEVLVRVALDGTPEPPAPDGAGPPPPPQLLRFSLSVQDSGIGIPLPAQARIFEQFAQADGSTTRRYGGSGLGLAICKRLLDLMGGTITVESAPGQGACFRFALALPLAARSSAREDEAAGQLARLAGARLLLVGERPALRESLRLQLQGWALSLSSAQDTAAALRQIEQAAAAGRPLALVLLDLLRPEQDGPQLTRAVARLALPAAAAPALILLGDDFLASLAPTAPTQDRLPGLIRLSKPLRRAELRRVLLEALAAGPPSAQPPAQVLAPPAGPAAVPTAVPDGRLRGRALLVEDNEVNQGLATAMLEQIGLVVTLASDGQEAVEKVRQQDFDLVLMDCQMPVMDGLEATRRIRAWEAGQPRPLAGALPIIALTATALEQDREACAAAGMSDFLAKPFSAAELRETLMRHLPRLPDLPHLPHLPHLPDTHAVAQGPQPPPQAGEQFPRAG